MHTATEQLVQRMRADKYVGLAADYGWTVLSGQARFVEGPALDVALPAGGRERVVAEHYLVATGSAPWAPPIPGLTEAGYLTSITALALDTLPASMIVLGGGASKELPDASTEVGQFGRSRRHRRALPVATLQIHDDIEEFDVVLAVPADTRQTNRTRAFTEFCLQIGESLL